MNNTKLDVLYEDNHLIAINKKSGDICQADKTGDIPLSEIVKEFLILAWCLISLRTKGIARNLSEEESKLFARKSSNKGLER